MKNKSLIVALIVVITAICIYQLHFSFVSRSVQDDAIYYATDENNNIDYARKQDYIDSVWTEPVHEFFGFRFTYEDVKKNELALGLDLQGGLYAVLEVSPVEILKALAANSKDPKFLQAIENAKKRQEDSQDKFTTLFYDEFQKLSDEENGLAKIFTNSSNKGKIDYTSTNTEVMEIINQEVDDAIDRSFQIIRTRIDKFGVSNPNIQKLPGSGRIMVELPGVDNPQRAEKLLSGVAKLEFLEVWTMQELGPFLQEFNNYLVKNEKQNNVDSNPQVDTTNTGSSDLVVGDEEETEGTSLVADNDEEIDTLDNDSEEQPDDLVVQEDSVETDEEEDSLLASTDEVDSTTTQADTTQNQGSNFLTSVMAINPNSGAFQVNVKDTARVNDMLARDAVKSIFPSDVQFLWEVKPSEGGVISLYPIRKGRDGKAPLEGDVITDARSDFQGSRAEVSMQMNAEGAKKWRTMTRENIGKQIAIVLDNVVYSAPVVNGEIPSGSSSISGNFTIEEAADLANILKAGKLPAPTRIVEKAIIGPSLGQQSISQGLSSMLIGLALVVVFMIIYYQLSGSIADVALLANIFFIVGVLAQLGAVLTLPGIAGIVLTIGMSVDANVLIYERIREELRNKKPLHIAINTGYNKAYSSIIDANATTFLTGVILYSFGSGPVKGFAVTLMIGIASSLFSAIFITRLLIEAFVGKNNKRKLTFESFISKNLLTNPTFEFVTRRRLAYIVSGVIIFVGMGLVIAQGGLNLGVDFTGGRSYVVEFNSPVSASDVRNEVSTKFEGGTEVKTFGANNILKVTTKYLINDESPEADAKVEQLLADGLTKFQDKKPEVVSSSKVGATIADDIANTSFLAIIFSLIVIFFYIFVRFRKFQFGLGALAALFHDVLVVISFFAIARALGIAYEVDQVFIAAMLTVVGYSINDTVVVFDRIREFAGSITGKDFKEKLNAAINQTLSRTVMTSSTTLIVILILFLAGGQVLSGFSYALLIGILVGTYSSVFIASPIVLDLAKIQLGKPKKTTSIAKKGTSTAKGNKKPSI